MQHGKRCIVVAALFFLYQLQLFSQTSDTARVLSLENAWNEAQSHKDVKALEGLLAATFVYTDADGAFSNRSQYLADIPDGTSTQIINEGMKAESYGETIVVTGAYREQGTDKGKTYLLRGRFTDTWIHQNGQWLCVASQETLTAH